MKGLALHDLCDGSRAFAATGIRLREDFDSPREANGPE
jgi:hypothetical protein